VSGIHQDQATRGGTTFLFAVVSSVHGLMHHAGVEIMQTNPVDRR